MAIFLGMWIPTATLIGMAYQSNLLASMVKTVFERPVADTFQDVIENGIKLIIIRGTFVERLLESSPDPHAKMAYEASGKNGGLMLIADYERERMKYHQEVQEGKAALSTSTLRFQGARRIFQLGKHLNVHSLHTGYYFRVGDPLIATTRPIIMSIIESGIFAKITADNI